LVRATFGAGAWFTGAVVLAVGFLTLISMARLWDESFWKPGSEPDTSAMSRVMLLPITGLSVITLAFTVAAGPLSDLTLRVSEQLLNPEQYMNAVLKVAQLP
jgi:multicomponent Na+:H+ antiporter subunit D